MTRLWLALLTLALLLAACAPASTPAATPTSTPTATATSTPTATPTPTETPRPTETPTPTPTPTETPIVSAEQEALLEQNMQQWLSGEMKIDESQLLFFAEANRYIPLGEVRGDGIDFNRDKSVIYQGVLLGQKVINGFLILLIGFEDRYGSRYALPFNAGPLENGLLVQVNQTPRFNVGQQSGETIQRIPVPQLAASLPNIVGKPIEFSSKVSHAGTPLENIPEDVKRQLNPSYPVAQEVCRFIEKATKGQMPAPTERVAPILNTIPEHVSVETLPSVIFIRQVGNWVVSP